MTNNSQSVTWRNWASIFDSMDREMSQPLQEHRAANISWVNPFAYRIFRTCTPITLFRCARRYRAIRAPKLELDHRRPMQLNCVNMGAR